MSLYTIDHKLNIVADTRQQKQLGSPNIAILLGVFNKTIEGPRKKTSPSNFGKIEHCQKHSKFHMQVCLCVLYTDLYLISCVFAFLSIIIVCRNENKVLAAFILHSQPVV